MINPGEGIGMHQLAQGLMNTSHDENSQYSEVGRECEKKGERARERGADGGGAWRGDEPRGGPDWTLRSNRLTPLRVGDGGLSL